MNDKQGNNCSDAELNIIRYLDRAMTQEELEQFNEWLLDSEDHLRLFKEVRDLHYGLKSSFTKREQQWQWFNSVLKRHVRCHMFFQVLRYAAVVIITIGLTWGFSKLLDCTSVPTYYTCDSNGMPTTMTLADGTFVKLGANSSLRFSSLFNKSQREVSLQGEGFFVVAKGDKPFKVKSGYNEITVTGTKFDINARDENLFVATLVEGSISFLNRQSNKHMTLTPGRRLEYDNRRQTLAISVSHATIDDYLADEHAFYSEPLSSILDRMGNVYDVEFVCESQKALRCRYRSIFNDGESLESFLTVIQSLTGLKYERINQNTIKLYQ